MLVGELMTRDVLTVQVGSTLQEAVRLMAGHRITAVPVLDSTGRVVGILSEADVLRRYTAADPRAHLRRPEPESAPWPRLVEEAMTAAPDTTAPGADVADVARRMAHHGWKSVPVVDDTGALAGLLSRSDVILALTTSDAVIRAQVLSDLAEAGRPQWTVAVEDGTVTIHGAEGPDDVRLGRDIAATARGVRRVVVAAPPD